MVCLLLTHKRHWLCTAAIVLMPVSAPIEVLVLAAKMPSPEIGADMRRREFITLLGGATAAWPLATGAQQVDRVRRIGVLWHAASAEDEAVYLGALREGLAELGYVEGRNIVLENRFPAEQREWFISLAAELVQLKPNVLVAVSRPAAMAAQRAYHLPAMAQGFVVNGRKFGLPYLPVAVHVSLLSCKATGKPKYSRQLEANEYDVKTTFHFTEIK
jgi:hypothetical protein